MDATAPLQAQACEGSRIAAPQQPRNQLTLESHRFRGKTIERITAHLPGAEPCEILTYDELPVRKTARRVEIARRSRPAPCAKCHGTALDQRHPSCQGCRARQAIALLLGARACAKDVAAYIEDNTGSVWATRSFRRFKHMAKGALIGMHREWAVIHSAATNAIHICTQHVTISLAFFFLHGKLHYRAVPSMHTPARSARGTESAKRLVTRLVERLCAASGALDAEDSNNHRNYSGRATATAEITHALLLHESLIVCSGPTILFITLEGATDVQHRLPTPIKGAEAARVGSARGYEGALKEIADALPLLYVTMGGAPSLFWKATLLPAAAGRTAAAMDLVTAVALSACSDSVAMSVFHGTGGLPPESLAAAVSALLEAGVTPGRLLLTVQDGAPCLAALAPWREIERAGALHPENAQVEGATAVNALLPYLALKYTRLAWWAPRRVRAPASLAEWAIKKEQRAASKMRSGAAGCEKPMSLRSLRRLHGDTRLEDAWSLLDETNIQIPSDFSDASGVRLRCFLARAAASSARLLMCHPRIVLPGAKSALKSGNGSVTADITVNGASVLATLAPGTAFTAGMACTARQTPLTRRLAEQLLRITGCAECTTATELLAAYLGYEEMQRLAAVQDAGKDTAVQAALGLGAVFGEGLCRGLGDEEARMLMDYFKVFMVDVAVKDAATAPLAPLLILLLGTRARQPRDAGAQRGASGAAPGALASPPVSAHTATLQDMHINSFFISAFQASGHSKPVRMAALAAAGIYNARSGNQLVFRQLCAECARYGPFDEEHNTEFYDARYRLLAASAASLVMSGGDFPVTGQFADMACGLLVDGMAALGSGRCPVRHLRAEEYRPAEVFLSALFRHASAYAAQYTVDDYVAFAVDEVKALGDLARGSGGRAHQQAGRLLAVGIGYLLAPLHGPAADAHAADGRCEAAQTCRCGLAYNCACASRRLFKHARRAYRDAQLQRVVDALLAICYSFETATRSAPETDLVPVYAALAAAVLRIGSGCLDVLRVLRRYLLNTHSHLNCAMAQAYSDTKKTVEEHALPAASTILLYKTGIGILCAGSGLSGAHGDRAARIDLCRALVVALYPDELAVGDLNLGAILGLATVRGLQGAHPAVAAWASAHVRQRARRRAQRRFMRRFARRERGLGAAGRKYTYDILSDYYENYHGPVYGGTTTLFNMVELAHVMKRLR